MKIKTKTRKSIAKRFKITKSGKGGKLFARTANQDHFNARESGNKKRKKRRDKKIIGRIKKSVMRQLNK